METIKLFENTWAFDEGGVRFFLLVGNEQALLIDSGMQTKNAKELAAELTKLPIKLINTHADRDHTGSNAEFDEVYMNPAETVNYYRKGAPSGRIVAVDDKDIIDLGDRELEIIAIPGHTPGSIAVLDKKSGALFSGDPVQDGNIYMFGPCREMHAYILSIEKLERLSDKYTTIYPSHGSLTVSKDILPKLREGAKKVLAGEIEAEAIDLWGNKVNLYKVGVAGFLYNE